MSTVDASEHSPGQTSPFAIPHLPSENHYDQLYFTIMLEAHNTIKSR